MFRPLPWEYGVRNLFRRPVRSGLTLLALALVVVLVLVVVGFVRGLEASLAVSGDPRVAIVHAPGGAENLEMSSVSARVAPVLAASVPAIQRRYGVAYVSPEVYSGTRVLLGEEGRPALGLVRGVTGAALLVRWGVQVTAGRWPGAGEVLVGRLAAAKLGCREADLAVGEAITFEGRTWTIAGRFASAGSALEAEVWCPLEELQQAMKRADCTLVAVTLAPGASFADLDEFTKERLDLEVQATREVDYYASLQRHYRPVRQLSWLMVGLIAFAGVFVGLNAMYGAVVGRARELATLQVVGFGRRAIVLCLVQESALLAVASSLLASGVALLLFRGVAIRFTMGAFTLQLDGPALLIGCGTGLLLGVLGALPPAFRALRPAIVDGLKAV